MSLSAALIAMIFVAKVDLKKDGFGVAYGHMSISAGTMFIRQENGDYCGVVTVASGLEGLDVCGSIVSIDSGEPGIRKIGDKVEIRIRAGGVRQITLQ